MSSRTALLVLAGVAGVAFVASRTERGRLVATDTVEAIVKKLTPRGIRNNNPGNIEWIENPAKRWRGMIGKDGRYGVFDTAANGVRAIGGEIRANFRRGENTIAEIITEWAPPIENNTAAYIRAVAGALGVDADTPLSLSQIPAVAAAIVKHENGVQPYSLDNIAVWVHS